MYLSHPNNPDLDPVRLNHDPVPERLNHDPDPLYHSYCLNNPGYSSSVTMTNFCHSLWMSVGLDAVVIVHIDDRIVVVAYCMVVPDPYRTATMDALIVMAHVDCRPNSNHDQNYQNQTHLCIDLRSSPHKNVCICWW